MKACGRWLSALRRKSVEQKRHWSILHAESRLLLASGGDQWPQKLWTGSRATDFIINRPRGRGDGRFATAHGVRRMGTCSLPWSELLPYRNIRVNLTEAVEKGWALERVEDFSEMLHCE